MLCVRLRSGCVNRSSSVTGALSPRLTRLVAVLMIDARPRQQVGHSNYHVERVLRDAIQRGFCLLDIALHARQRGLALIPDLDLNNFVVEIGGHLAVCLGAGSLGAGPK